MSEDVLSTVRRLVALAASSDTPEPEARTAARKACILIQRHALLVSTLPSAADPPEIPLEERIRTARERRARGRKVPGAPDLVEVLSRGVGDAAEFLTAEMLRRRSR